MSHMLKLYPKSGRSKAFFRLAGVSVAVYVGAATLLMSAAHADDSGESTSDQNTAPEPIEVQPLEPIEVQPPETDTPAPPVNTSAPTVEHTGEHTAQPTVEHTGEHTGGHSNSQDEGDAPQSKSHAAQETCDTLNNGASAGIRISRSDLSHAQQAIRAGTAKPLEQIWGTFTASYTGRVIGMEFVGRKNNPRYLFRAISRSGRLETVTISAQTGRIENITGCG